MKDFAGYTARLVKKAGKLFAGRFCRDRVPLPVVFGRFRRVLENHNRAIEIITDMGEKLGGDYLFDITYLRRAYTELRENINDSIESFGLLTQGKYSGLKAIFGRIDREINRLLFDEVPASREMVLFFEDITWDRGSETGGKNANLAVLKNELKLSVPDGFSLTTSAFTEFIRHNGIDAKIAALGQDGDITEEELMDIRSAILRGEMPPALNKEIGEAIKKLGTRCSGHCPLAVRSSAVEEDGEYSFAGQYESVLNVPLGEAAVEDAYRQVLASLFTEKSAAYHRQAGLDIKNARMAVGCLFMVDAAVSGVLYSENPGGERNTQLISATWGLGKSIVEGQTDADSYLIRKGGQPVITQKKTGRKNSMVVNGERSGIDIVSTPSNMAGKSSLTDEQALDLAALGARIEAYFRTPQDIEWALDREGRFSLLQTRPLRVAEQTLRSGRAKELKQYVPVLLEAKGLVVQPGAAAGKVFLLRHMDDLDHFPRGAVLVAHHDSSNFVRVMPFVSAIITDVGTPTSHMASVCREFRIPALVNAGDASSILRHGQEVTLLADDEGNAIVYEGIVDTLIDHVRSGSAKMDELYEFRKKRYVLRFISPLNLIDPLLDNFVPEGCKTMHDILRFIHEKSVAGLIEGARDGGQASSAVKLELPIPAGIMVADIGGGIREQYEGRSVSFEDIVSIPFRAILKGMMHPGAWHADTVSLGAQDFFSSMMRMPDIVSDSSDYLRYNVAVISHDYVNLNLRFGYHYNMMDCFCSDNARNNHIYFRFAGGATDILKRSRRLELIARILREFGFTIKIKGDLIIARLSNISREEMEKILDQTGRLIAFARQLDAVLHDEASVERYARKFMGGEYIL
ncbi:MAG: PEP-utilizing enzyme [Nitrospirota bacterium]|nr:PEP-utilizing enzyme [Nitrospirota bacterium]